MRAHRAASRRWLLAVVLLAGWAGASAGEHPAAAPSAGESVFAWYAFDEPLGARLRDGAGRAGDVEPRPGSAAAMERVEGVHGGAIRLAGRHQWSAPATDAWGELRHIALSAWVRPVDLAEYKEIFRKDDGDCRVLFSFQHDGTILSLGLNVGGYVECDAPLDPATVLDGRWHHCAATFDGQTMRVYFDGDEIGRLDRPGKIAAGGPADACIGSSSGSECFQGTLDDLRIHDEALPPDAIAQMHQEGRGALELLARAEPADEPLLDGPPLAHWTFNEGAGAGVIRESAAAADIGAPAAGRVRGVHGNALVLGDSHQLVAMLPQSSAELPGVSFSAWVRPGELSGFREIVRRECPGRLLFSFQEGGKILSLGLNVGGYVECDAEVDPAVLRDGGWHHCAGTFDGQTMRVYLDGRQVGALPRPGVAETDPAVPLFLGSSSGQGEFYQGAMDDVRIVATGLTPDQIDYLYRSGLEALDRQLEAMREELAAVYGPGESFAEVLAATRRNLFEKNIVLTRDLADAVTARLRSEYPEELGNFASWTGASAVEYLMTPGNAFHRERVGRLVDLLLEYKPLTPEQWQRSTEAKKDWSQADSLAAQFAKLMEAGDAASYSPEWIALALAAGPRIDFRPTVSEAVAPYVVPATPETRDRSAEEAEDLLRRDWLHQAGGAPTPERIGQEIAWTRELAGRILADYPGQADFAAALAELDRLAARAATLTEPDEALYLAVRAAKRQIALGNPVVDFDQILFVDMPYPQGSEWPHETRHRLGYMAVPGARLMVLEGLSPAGHLRQLMPQPPLHGSFWRPDLSWDATKVVFCFKPHNEKSFHLYEIGVDGRGLRQLTDGIYDDLDPVYLPDGHILFSTTRGHTYVRCMPPTNAFVLARCDADGRNVYLVSANNEPDYLPSVMHDGRVIYTRWEYTDKPLWRAQGLWTMNPDGTQVNTFWGNQTVWPDLLKDARAIPGSRRVMFTGSAHHNWFSGSVGILDPDRGYNFPHGLTKVTADVAWPESGNGPVDPVESPRYHAAGNYAGYYSPYPLSEKDFLVSANRGGKFVLYLMDVDGNRELIHEGLHHIFHAVPLRPRARPPVLPDRVAWPTRENREHPAGGVLYSGNVYQGAPPELQDRARFLRVMHIEPKTYTYWHKRPALSTGPVVSIVQSEGVKQVVGTVPIEADGSVALYVPSGQSLHFQLLDAEGRALQTMRSFVNVMPGERRGCLGCHESHSRTPVFEGKALALVREPSAIAPPPWEDRSISYPRYVQPVLDRYCGSCHQGQGEAVKVVDLTPTPGGLGFVEPYYLLTGRPSWGRPYEKPETPPPGFGIAGMLMVEGYSTTDPEAYKTPAPMTKLSYRSRLVELCASGKHYGVKVDEESLQRITLWVDAMCPYQGDEEIRAMDDPQFPGVDWLAIRPRIQTAPRIVRPGPVD